MGTDANNSPRPEDLLEISQAWGLVESGGSAPVNFDIMLAAMTQMIEHWLDSDRRKLQNALYRLDVSERHTHEAMKLPKSQQAPRLAELILRRELQKAETRRASAAKKA